jgi:hypothetical protein
MASHENRFMDIRNKWRRDHQPDHHDPIAQPIRFFLPLARTTAGMKLRYRGCPHPPTGDRREHRKARLPDTPA